jgi:hypothetical protein
MNLPEIKIYAVSLSACQKSQDLLDESKGMLYYEHAPLILTSVNIQTAADQARIIAFDNWKPQDGWFMHSADILPMTKDFVGQILGLAHQGILAVDDSETKQFFRFDESSATDFDNNVSTNAH